MKCKIGKKIKSKSKRKNRILVAARLCGFAPLFQRRQIPKLDGMIRRAGSEGLAVRAEGQALNDAGMPGKEVKLLAGGRVPDRQLLRLAARQALAVGTECQTVDRAVTGEAFLGRIETEQFLARVRVPDADGLVVRGAGQTFAVRTVDLVADRTGVAFECPHRAGVVRPAARAD